MARRPRRSSTEAELYAAALRALARRSYSVHEMRQYLEARTEHKTAVRGVLARLRQQTLLDDARYARQFARYRAEVRRQGRYRIARELRARGVADRYIEAALQEIFTATDEAAALRARLERRLRGIHGPLDRKRLAALYRSLLRAGFSAELIRDELRRVAREAAPHFAEEN
jgi:regulatory protein